MFNLRCKKYYISYFNTLCPRGPVPGRYKKPASQALLFSFEYNPLPIFILNFCLYMDQALIENWLFRLGKLHYLIYFN